jgi:hypothetical protein
MVKVHYMLECKYHNEQPCMVNTIDHWYPLVYVSKKTSIEEKS